MKRAIFVEGRRDGYHPGQCDYTMTVGELKEMLEQFNDDDKIFLSVTIIYHILCYISIFIYIYHLYYLLYLI